MVLWRLVEAFLSSLSSPLSPFSAFVNHPHRHHSHPLFPYQPIPHLQEHTRHAAHLLTHVMPSQISHVPGTRALQAHLAIKLPSQLPTSPPVSVPASIPSSNLRLSPRPSIFAFPAPISHPQLPSTFPPSFLNSPQLPFLTPSTSPVQLTLSYSFPHPFILLPSPIPSHQPRQTYLQFPPDQLPDHPTIPPKHPPNTLPTPTSFPA